MEIKEEAEQKQDYDKEESKKTSKTFSITREQLRFIEGHFEIDWNGIIRKELERVIIDLKKLKNEKSM